MSLNYAYAKALAIYKALLPLAQQKIKILDFCCGDGEVSDLLRKYFIYSQLFVVEADQELFALVKDFYPKLNAGLLKKYLEFQTSFFDLVVACDIFHHFNKDEQLFWFSELFRVLKPGGFLVISELNPLSFVSRKNFCKNPLELDAKMVDPFKLFSFLKKHGNVQIKFFLPKKGLPKRMAQCFLVVLQKID